MLDCVVGQAINEMASGKKDIVFMTAEMLYEISADNQSFISPDTKELVDYVPAILRRMPQLLSDWKERAGMPWKYIPLLVIDEIHCISDAGHDFRIKYAQVWARLASHPWFKRALKLGLTATINPRVRSSLDSFLPATRDWHQVLGNLYRDNIEIRILPRPNGQQERINYVLQLHQKYPVK